MNQFIELTFANGYKAFVRTSAVVAVVAVHSKKDGAMLDIGRNIEYAVQETPEEVLEKIRAAEGAHDIEPAAEPADIEPDDSDRGKIVEVRGDSRLWLQREFLARSGDGLFVCKSALDNRDFRGWKHARRIREA